jgi:trehalose/maltose hydrolase-like predicted phosphorylase
MNGDTSIQSPRQTATGVASASLFIPVDPTLTIDPSWALVEEGFSLAREHEIESICTVANGYVGTRGSLAEGSSLSSPATFLAGVFDAGADSPASPALVVLPDWTQLRIFVEESRSSLKPEKSLNIDESLIFSMVFSFAPGDTEIG